MTNNEIEKKWQKIWREEKLFQSDPNEKEKLFLTVAYPYTMYYSLWHGT